MGYDVQSVGSRIQLPINAALYHNRTESPTQPLLSAVTYTTSLLPRLSCDRSTASSKEGSPQHEIQCFLFQVPVCSRFLKVILQLLTFSSAFSCPFFLFIFQSVTCCGRHFLGNMSQIYSAFLHFVVPKMFLSPLTTGNTSSFSHDGSN